MENKIGEPALSATELMAWVDTTASNWKALLGKHPEALQLPCDIAKVKNVAELLQHIVAVELRYAERLAGLAETSYEAIPFGSAEEIDATHERAMGLLRGLLRDDGYDWSREIEFGTRSMGKLAAARRAILFHTLLHSMRHYAQLATLVRQHGIKPEWPVDYLLMAARPVEG